MANTKQAKKSVRKIERQTAVNRSRKTSTRKVVKKAELMLKSPAGLDIAAIKSQIVDSESMLMRAAQKKVIKKKTASRKVSRLVKHLKKLEAASA